MGLRVVKEAVGVILKAWHSLARRQAFVKEVPSFLPGNLEFNKSLSGVLGNMVINPSIISSCCLQKIEPTALDVRDALWKYRHKVATWSMPGARMEDCMPARLLNAIGWRGEVKQCNRSCFSLRCTVMTQFKKWWMQQPPNTESTWLAEATQIYIASQRKRLHLRSET